MCKHQSMVRIKKVNFLSSLFESRTYSHYLYIELLAPVTSLPTLIHRKKIHLCMLTEYFGPLNANESGKSILFCTCECIGSVCLLYVLSAQP